MEKAWNDFIKGNWVNEIDVRDFILKNYTEYLGDDSFLTEPTENTKNLWDNVLKLLDEEKAKGGVLDADTEIVSTITSHKPGYIDKELEKIVGLQTDKPLKRALMPFGGIRTAATALKSYDYEIDEKVTDTFTNYRKTHNQGVFDAYTPEMKKARHSGIITGLPDAYGRGRIIGDYRRVPLYGVDRLIEDKMDQATNLPSEMNAKNIQLREEITEQINALKKLKIMAESYGYDISKPATSAQEAVQFLYFAYLGAIKEQNGAAMSLGRTSTFLDIYIQRDLENKVISEEEAQEIIDHFIMKLRLVKFMRSPEYNDLFSGDPTWVTESVAGMAIDGRSLVTKNSFRYLHTLINLGPAPEPNLTVLYSVNLPREFKEFCARVSIQTSSVQYENDDLMRANYGDDYAIACCVSAMRVGKEMQYFGARANLAKALLYAINGGVDEKTKEQVGPELRVIDSEYLDYDEVMKRYDETLEWLAELYCNTLNVIHYMHDKYSYEALQMSLHDRDVKRNFATGIAGLSVVADSLSAIKYAKVKQIRDEDGVAVDFETTGDFPKYGNNDNRVDDIAALVVKKFMNYIRKQYHLRDSVASMSVLTITSNVVYGKKTGTTPDGRKKGEPFAPGANPMHGRDQSGALASLSSVAKLPYQHAQDGISNTFSIVPESLGKDEDINVCNPFLTNKRTCI